LAFTKDHESSDEKHWIHGHQKCHLFILTVKPFITDNGYANKSEVIGKTSSTATIIFYACFYL